MKLVRRLLCLDGTDDERDCPWHRRARRAVGYSLRIRLVLVFMALAVTVAVTFMGGVQKAVSVGWREAARPLLMDYVDRLAAEIGSPRARSGPKPSPSGCQSRCASTGLWSTGHRTPTSRAPTG